MKRRQRAPRGAVPAAADDRVFQGKQQRGMLLPNPGRDGEREREEQQRSRSRAFPSGRAFLGEIPSPADPWRHGWNRKTTPGPSCPPQEGSGGDKNPSLPIRGGFRARCGHAHAWTRSHTHPCGGDTARATLLSLVPSPGHGGGSASAVLQPLLPVPPLPQPRGCSRLFLWELGRKTRLAAPARCQPVTLSPALPGPPLGSPRARGMALAVSLSQCSRMGVPRVGWGCPHGGLGVPPQTPTVQKGRIFCFPREFLAQDFEFLSHSFL